MKNTHFGITYSTHVLKLVILVTTLITIFSSLPSYASEPETYIDKMHRKYGGIFIITLDMIQKKQFGQLEDLYTKSLLLDSRQETKTLSIEKWDDHPEIYYIIRKDSLSALYGEKGYRVNFPIDWTANPKNNNTWVLYFQSLQWLNDYLEKGEEGDDISSLVAFKVIRDWIVSNANWFAIRNPKNRYIYKDHATARRLKVFCRAMRLYRNRPYKDDEFFNLLLTGILSQIAMMSTKIEYSHHHNHGIMTDNSLLEVLVDFKEFKRQKELQLLAAKRISEQYKNAFTVEGVHKEHSPCYHNFVTRLLAQSINFMDRSEIPVAPYLKNLFDSTAQFYTHVLKPDGTIPRIGDCVSGIAGKLSTKYYDNYPEAAFATTKGHKGVPPSELFKVFPESGWAFFRDKWPADIYAVIQSDYYSTAHYQEDDTSFTLEAYGNNLIIDPGLHTYERSNPFTQFMSAARAHNVLIVDDTGFNPSSLSISLSGITRFHINENPLEKWNAIIELTHAHYEQELSVKLYRQYGQINGSNFMVNDLYASAQQHKYSQLFHLAPNAITEYHGNGIFRITWENHPYVLWLKSSFDSFDVIKGSIQPVQGWYFPKFGVASKSPVLRLHKTDKSGSFLTLINVSHKDSTPLWERLDKTALRMSVAIDKIARRRLISSINID